MSPDTRLLFVHLSRALSRYLPEAAREGRANGQPPPKELLVLAEFFADCARVRQDATSLGISGEPVDGGAMTDGLLLTKRQAAAELSVSVRQLERLIADGTNPLNVVRLGGAVRVRRSALEQYVAGLAEAPRSFRDDLTQKDTA